MGTSCLWVPAESLKVKAGFTCVVDGSSPKASAHSPDHFGWSLFGCLVLVFSPELSQWPALGPGAREHYGDHLVVCTLVNWALHQSLLGHTRQEGEEVAGKHWWAVSNCMVWVCFEASPRESKEWHTPMVPPKAEPRAEHAHSSTVISPNGFDAQAALGRKSWSWRPCAAPLGAAPAILSSMELEIMQFMKATHNNVWEKVFVLM